MGMLDTLHGTLEEDQGSLTAPGGAVDETVPGESGAPASDEQSVEIEGQRYSLEQIKEAIDALNNRETWEAGYKQRDQKTARTRKAVEDAFGKRFTDLTEQDLYDIRAFGLFNLKLKTDTAFRSKWLETLAEALGVKYRQAGMPPAEAAAKAKVEATKAVDAQAAGDAGALQRLEQKLNTLEQTLTQRDQAARTEQTLAALEQHVGKTLNAAVTKLAADLPAYGSFLKRHVLYYLDGYTDQEIADAVESGELNRMITALVKDGIKLVKGTHETDLRKKAEAVRQKDAGTSPPPLRGAAAGAAGATSEPKRGAGLSRMTDRLIEAFKG